MSKWYARTCEVNRDGDITRELLAPTVNILLGEIKEEPANHWTVWKDGEYKETITTLWYSPGHERFGEMFATHSVSRASMCPKPPKDDPEEGD